MSSPRAAEIARVIVEEWNPETTELTDFVLSRFAGDQMTDLRTALDIAQEITDVEELIGDDPPEAADVKLLGRMTAALVKHMNDPKADKSKVIGTSMIEKGFKPADVSRLIGGAFYLYVELRLAGVLKESP